MRKLVECVPNFSEGRDPATIAELAAAIRGVPGVALLHSHHDADHNRSVMTFVGDPGSVLEAAVRAARRAVDLIDLNFHQGEHPRIGAIDVLPFIPLEDTTMQECVELARHAGERISRELGLPVYLYEHAAIRAERASLAHIRRGEFEGLLEESESDPDRLPDFGGPRLHPTAGAVAVGARRILVAFNVNLATDDLSVARKIATAVRGRDGGLRFVQALGFRLRERAETQVSMNLTNVEQTPIFRAFEMVKTEAARYGVAISGSEVVGLVPQDALNACADYSLRIENFRPELVLENCLHRAFSSGARSSNPASIDRFIDEVAAESIVPGGGSVAASAGALAAALGAMVCRLTLTHAAQPSDEARSLLTELEDLRGDLLSCIAEDTESYQRVMAAKRLPRETEAERLQRPIAVEQAIKGATAVPLRTAESALAVLELLDELAEIAKTEALSDLAVGAQMALAAIRGASYVILANLDALGDAESSRQTKRELDDLITRGEEIAEEIEAQLNDKV